MAVLSVIHREPAALLQIRGSGSLAALAAMNLEVPDAWFTYGSTASLDPQRLDFVARLGSRECLLYCDQDEQLANRIAATVVADTFVFPRDDTVLAIAGERWEEMMLQICSFDLGSSQPPQFVMASAAGISIWMRIPAAGEPLLVGCDPSYGDYLVSTLEQIIQEFNYMCTQAES